MILPSGLTSMNRQICLKSLSVITKVLPGSWKSKKYCISFAESKEGSNFLVKESKSKIAANAESLSPIRATYLMAKGMQALMKDNSVMITIQITTPLKYARDAGC